MFYFEKKKTIHAVFLLCLFSGLNLCILSRSYSEMGLHAQMFLFMLLIQTATGRLDNIQQTCD